jgi:hypothetical protein
MATAKRSVHDIFTARLYHYQRFHPGRLETTLREAKVYCANPASLNDPWDCKPCFTTKSYLSLDPERMSAGVQGEIARPGIYCLTPDPLSTLMWAHYGANHTGICLEFHVSNLLFLKALAVEYQVEYPEILTEELYTRETVAKVLLTKAECWRYEEEFRLIGSPDLPEDNPLWLHENYLKIPDLALMSVIVGCNGNYHAVKSLVEECAPGLRVSRIVRAPNEYKLLFGLPEGHDRKRKMLSWPRSAELTSQLARAAEASS